MTPLDTFAICLGVGIAADIAALLWLRRRIHRRRRMRAEQDARDRANVWQHRPAAPRPTANPGAMARPWVIVPELIGALPSTATAEAPDATDGTATFAELVVPIPHEETTP